MSNFLAGAFDAVVQLSRGTVNRLLATTHQNKEGYSKTMPLSPQKLAGRIGAMNWLLQVRAKSWNRLGSDVCAGDRDRITRFKHCVPSEPFSY